MDLYFSPLACSMATRIALYEAGARRRLHRSRPQTKRLPDGSDFLADQSARHGADPAHRRRRAADRERRDPAIRRRALPRRQSRADERHRARPAAAVAVLHRHRAAQGRVHAAARQKAPADAKAYALGLADVAARASSRSISPAANSCSTAFSVADAYLVHGAELDPRRADRSREMAGDQGLSCPHCASGRASRAPGPRKPRCMPRSRSAKAA